MNKDVELEAVTFFKKLKMERFGRYDQARLITSFLSFFPPPTPRIEMVSRSGRKKAGGGVGELCLDPLPSPLAGLNLLGSGHEKPQ